MHDTLRYPKVNGNGPSDLISLSRKSPGRIDKVNSNPQISEQKKRFGRKFVGVK